MTIKILQKQWESFEKAVMPKGASLVQQQEMRRAFYAGASAMFGLVTDLGDDDADEGEECKILDGLQNECIEFMSQVGKKY